MLGEQWNRPPVHDYGDFQPMETRVFLGVSFARIANWNFLRNICRLSVPMETFLVRWSKFIRPQGSGGDFIDPKIT